MFTADCYAVGINWDDINNIGGYAVGSEFAVDEEGKKYVDSSHFVLSVGTSQPDDRSISLTGTEPVKVEINLA